jgi:hypothetical protein
MVAPSAELSLNRLANLTQALLAATQSPTSARDFLIEVQEGNLAGLAVVNKFGRNDAVPNGSWEFVSLLGLTSWPLSAPTAVRIKAGGNAADTAAGAGAREVTVQGIDSDFNEVSEAVATAGAAASLATTISFWRIHRAWVSSAGTYGAANTDDIVVENSGGGTDLIEIAAGEGQTQFGGWTVPVGKTAYLLAAEMRVDSNKSANIRMFTRENIDVVSAPVSSKRIRLFFDGVSGEFHYDPPGTGKLINEKSDIWFEAFGDGGVVEVSCDFTLLVVDN